MSPPSLVAFGGHKLLMEFILDLMPSVKGSQGNKFFPFLRSSKIDMILKHIDIFFVCQLGMHHLKKLCYVIFSQTYDDDEDHIIDIQNDSKLSVC